MTQDKLTSAIIGCAINVHRKLGPGLLESAYKECLYYELNKRTLTFGREKPMPIIYEEVKLDHGYRIDLLVENQIVIEIKTVECLTDVHTAQILTYMKLGNYSTGLLLNFNAKVLKDGIRRFKI